MMLAEHEAAAAKESASGDIYSPTDAEKALLKKCEGLFKKAKRDKRKYDFCWIDYYKMFRGRQWREQRPSYRASEVFNLIWETLQSQVPVIVDQRPKFEFLPQEPSDREFADLMNDICAADWQRYNWLYKLTEVVYDAHIYGTGLSCLKFDPKLDRIVYHSTDPFYLFPDPSAEDFRTKCGYVVHAEPMDVEKVKHLFPNQAEHIKADVVDFQSEKRVDLSSQRYSVAASENLYLQIIGGYDNSTPPQVLVKTIYLEDDEVLEESIKDPEFADDAPPKVQRRLKYPNGRMVIIANEVVLYDGEIEYEDDVKFPYQRLTNYILPRSFWGISEIEPLESPQRAFNKIVSYALDVLYLAGNPIWVVDNASGVDTDNLTNQPGLVVTKEPGTEVRREEGVQLQPYVLQLVDRMKEWFERSSGSQDVSRGIASGGVTAASAIADLQAAAQTRARLKMKNLDAYLQDLGAQYASRVLQFYTAPQVFRLTGKDGTEKYFKMSIQQNEDGTHTAMVRRFTDNALLNPTDETYQLRGKLDVRVTTGSSLPFSKQQTEQRVLNLFDRGLLDAEEVLKVLDYPNYEAILGRLDVARQQQAAQETMAPSPKAGVA